MAYISLPSDLNAIIGIKSYYFVILKMVISHDAIKTIQRLFVFFPNKEQKPVSFQKKQKKTDKKNKTCALFFYKPGFFQP